MAADEPHVANDELQFDRVASTGAPGSTPAVTCVVCKTPVTTNYFHINGKTTCERCKNGVVAATAVPKGIAPMGKSIGLGILAAIAGAALYYAVIKITNFEIGIVAIAIGYMVGWGVRKGAHGRGGRRFQILAVVLAYWAVGLAYVPLVYGGVSGHAKSASVRSGTATDTTGAAGTAAPTDSSGAIAKDSITKKSTPSLLLSFGALFLLVFALPVMMIAGSMPGGILSAFIIFIGLRQAWHMTAAPVLKISGPYRVGSGPAAAST